MPLAAGEPQPLHEALQAARVHGAAVQGHGQRHVLHNVEHRHEVVELVHQPHLAAAEHRQLLVGASVHVGAIQQHVPRGGPIHAADEVQQGGLARARRAHNGHELALFHAEGHVI